MTQHMTALVRCGRDYRNLRAIVERHGEICLVPVDNGSYRRLGQTPSN